MPGSRIFISYRHADSAAYAGRLYDRFKASYGEEEIFRDLDMDYGIDFVERIEDTVGACAVMLVVIGPVWLNARDAAGNRRLDDADDYVRIEVSSALRRSIRVIPVLVGDAKMPVRDELPDALSGLARRHALEMSDSRWDYDVDRLMQTVSRVLQDQEPKLADKPAPIDKPSGRVVTQPPPSPIEEAPPPSATKEPGRSHAPATKREPKVPPPAVPEPGAITPSARKKGTHRRRTVALIGAAAVIVAAVAIIALASDNGRHDGSSQPPPVVNLGRARAPSGLAVDPTTNSLWVAEHRPGALAQIQLAGFKLKRTLPLRPKGAAPAYIVIGEPGIVWASDPARGQLIRVDTRDGSTIPVATGGRPEGLARSPYTGKIWDAERANHRVVGIWRNSDMTFGKRPFTVPGSPSGIAIGERGIVWVSDPAGGQLIRLDTRDATTKTVATGGTPQGLARDPDTGKIWVADSARNEVIRVGRASTSEPFSTREVPVGAGPVAVAIDNGIVWVANARAGTVSAISTKTYRRLGPDRAVGKQPADIQARGGRVWVTCSGEGTVTEIRAP